MFYLSHKVHAILYRFQAEADDIIDITNPIKEMYFKGLFGVAKIFGDIIEILPSPYDTLFLKNTTYIKIHSHSYRKKVLVYTNSIALPSGYVLDYNNFYMIDQSKFFNKAIYLKRIQNGINQTQSCKENVTFNTNKVQIELYCLKGSIHSKNGYDNHVLKYSHLEYNSTTYKLIGEIETKSSLEFNLYNNITDDKNEISQSLFLDDKNLKIALFSIEFIRQYKVEIKDIKKAKDGIIIVAPIDVIFTKITNCNLEVTHNSFYKDGDYYFHYCHQY